MKTFGIASHLAGPTSCVDVGCCVYVCIYVHVCVYVCMYVYVCMCVRVCTLCFRASDQEFDDVATAMPTSAWVELLDNNNTPYYHNARTGESSWEPPEEYLLSKQSGAEASLAGMGLFCEAVGPGAECDDGCRASEG